MTGRTSDETRIAMLEAHVVELQAGVACLGVEAEAWYLALQMLVARLIHGHLPVETVAKVLAEVTSDVATDFDERITHQTLRHLDAIVRVLLSDMREVVRERGGKVES